jgi:hypothetical protein
VSGSIGRNPQWRYGSWDRFLFYFVTCGLAAPLNSVVGKRVVTVGLWAQNIQLLGSWLIYGTRVRNVALVSLVALGVLLFVVCESGG